MTREARSQCCVYKAYSLRPRIGEAGFSSFVLVTSAAPSADASTAACVGRVRVNDGLEKRSENEKRNFCWVCSE